ncbi:MULTISPECIES: homoserine O-acetyltransferase MetX [unclassified Leucobacter]|uniref:homoserine O-acetyltransferase MetX n=1 Tax=unclassified Leucobacter TaxID=2621730 RepID=UPI000622623C|nr:homoserine O-acetyltransferase [Leucobacter sp. Ag1]KKI16642.1 homoserine acetyltransferase [Leucobacter sp. Ag1]
MDWQTPEDSFPTDFITDAQLRALIGRPPISGAWRDGDPVGSRKFLPIGDFVTEAGDTLPGARIAYETFGELTPARDNAILVFHALTGDSHLAGPAGPGHPTDGWWAEIVGPGKALDTDRYCVIAPNVLGGCQGSTGPASLDPSGREWGGRFPYLTIRDQVNAAARFVDELGIARFRAVIGGSVGGMHALEWQLSHPDRADRLAVIAAPPVTTADQIGLNLVQLEAIRSDPAFRGGNYYDAPDGVGPHHGLATARRLALLNYRSNTELDERFGRAWQSAVSPLGGGGRFAVESYLDFHGNKFTRRFDAGSYVALVQAMNSHDVGRGRGGVAAALQRLELPTLVLGIPSDRLFTIDGQDLIAEHAPGSLDGDRATRIDSPFGHDAFLIEFGLVGAQLERLLAA